MPSPFPGMNPYLEQEDAWHDFHESFMPLAREVLNTQVLPRYFVKIDEHIYIHELDEERRRFVGRADLAVTPASHTQPRNVSTGIMEAPAQVLQPAVDIERLSYLEVRDRQNRELVTIIELLSPSNKRLGLDRDQYLAKCAQLLSSSVNFVEIDLLRGGPRMPWLQLPACDYYGLVSRVNERPKADVWPAGLRGRLPIIPIPLRPGEPEASLDLQQILHRVYDSASYEAYIYSGEPNPPLLPEDAAWAKQLVPPRP